MIKLEKNISSISTDNVSIYYNITIHFRAFLELLKYLI